MPVVSKKVALRLAPEVFLSIAELARRDGRSINAEITVLLREAAETRVRWPRRRS